MRQSVLDRFFSRIDAGLARDECWVWRGTRYRAGYGQLGVKNRSVCAHRFAYEHFVGPIPDGLVLDHFKCENKSCVNPWHVRPVSQRENVLRGETMAALHASRTHCTRGHEYSAENTRLYDGRRYCLACRKHYKAVNRARKRASREAAVSH